MNEAERRVTLKQEGTAEIEEKKSVFIGHAKPVSSEEEAQEYIRQIKAQYADARHNVWAYRLQGDVVMRCSDDGEPQGTGGVPALDALRKSGVSNAVVVVTRYFGGILLGAGGLVRCYSKAALLAVREAQIVTREKCRIWQLSCSYPNYQRYLAELPKFHAVAGKTDFAETVTFQVTVRPAFEENLLARLREMSGGALEPLPVGEVYLPIESEL